MTTLTEAPPRARRLAAGAAAVTVLLWASSFVAIRHLGTDISAGALSLARLGLGSIFLGALLVKRSRPAVRRWPAQRDWLPLIACGVLWFGVLLHPRRRLRPRAASAVRRGGRAAVQLVAGGCRRTP